MLGDKWCGSLSLCKNSDKSLNEAKGRWNAVNKRACLSGGAASLHALGKEAGFLGIFAGVHLSLHTYFLCKQKVPKAAELDEAKYVGLKGRSP